MTHPDQLAEPRPRTAPHPALLTAFGYRDCDQCGDHGDVNHHAVLHLTSPLYPGSEGFCLDGAVAPAVGLLHVLGIETRDSCADRYEGLQSVFPQHPYLAHRCEPGYADIVFAEYDDLVAVLKSSLALADSPLRRQHWINEDAWSASAGFVIDNYESPPELVMTGFGLQLPKQQLPSLVSMLAKRAGEQRLAQIQLNGVPATRAELVEITRRFTTAPCRP